MTTILYEGNRLADILRQELDGFSRDEVILAAGESYALCAVVGRVDLGTPVATASASNAGTGLVHDLALGETAEIGEYSLGCVGAASNAGSFHVFTPSGLRLADAVVGEPYASPHLAFTITDGETDFAVGDAFTVTVPAGSGKYKPLDPDAVDGTQHTAGFTIAAYDATLGDVRGVIVGRFAKVLGDLLAWPTGITTAQKTKALAELAALGIKSCKGV